MNESYQGFFPATILKYNAVNRTAKVSIPTITDGIEDGITATFAYPVGHDDKDTELQILDGAECYIFFLRGKVESPVISHYRSHGVGAVVDYRRIRQENIELFADANININATDVIDLTAKTVNINADNIVFNAKNTKNTGDFENNGKSNLKGETTIQDKKFLGHGHSGIERGSSNSGGVV